MRDAQNTAWLNRAVPGGTLLTLGCWYHVTGVYNLQNNSIKTYVNGVLDRELDSLPVTALASTTGNFIMGREPWTTPTRYFDGTIDDVRVYNRALSDQEIKTLANTSVHIHCVSTLQTSGGQSGTYDFICSAPTPLPPLAPGLTIGGSLPMNLATVSGDVQANAVTGVATSSVNGNLVYASTFSDSHGFITVTLDGKSPPRCGTAG